MIVRGVAEDDARGGRPVPYKIYHPASSDIRGDDAPYPLIVWSHGLGGSRDGAGFIARFLASHGYIVCNIQHRGTDTILWEGKEGHPWDNIRKAHIPRSATIDRFRDVPFFLDQLPLLREKHADAFAHADMDVIGMSGHSFGAMTTQIMAGQGFPDETGALFRMREARFRAGILYSPVPIRHLSGASDDDIYGTIDLPLFHMTGTDDASPVEKFTYELRRILYAHSHLADRHMLVMQDGDHMVYNGSRGQLDDNPKREVHEIIVKIAALAYWDMYLKNDEAARIFLTGGAFAAWLNGEGAYEWMRGA